MNKRLLSIPGYIFLSLLTILLLTNRLHASVDDPAYHTLEEINARIFALQDSVPEWVRVDSIGHSQEEGLPIYVVKVNERVHEDVSERPAVFFHDLHAEEVLGVEFQMWLLEKLVKHDDRKSRDWWRYIDTWICPTSNPEGLREVFKTDPSWRKNKRCNLQDGRFRWVKGWGGDTSGVDMNRNFPLFWIHGDGFLMHGRNELYDYYRGPGPLSEAETQALDRFVDRIRPLFALTLHSSRTGNVAERIYYPWGRGWEKYSNPKFSPDIDAIRNLAECMVARTSKYGEPTQTYLAAPVGSYVGECDSYFYWKYGVISMRIEIGGAAEAMQPDSVGIMQVIDGCHDGIEYMLNCAIETTNTNEDEKGGIDQRRVDVKTTSQDEPVEAVIHLKKRSDPMMPYRITSPRTGLYQWLLPTDFTDTLTVRKYGYYSHRGRVSSNTPRSAIVRINMIPLPTYTMTLQAVTPDSAIIQDDVELEIRHSWTPQAETGWGSGSAGDRIDVPLNHPDNVWQYTMQNGHIEIELPQGGYYLTFVNGTAIVPRRIEVDLESDNTIQIVLPEAVSLLYQDFDGVDIIYTSDNLVNPSGQAGDSLARWEITDGIYHSYPRCLTDTRYGSTLINEDGWCAPYNMLDDHFNLETAGSAALVYWLNQALEPGYDSMWVEVSMDGSAGSDPNDWTWIQLAPAHQELSILQNVPERPWNAAPVNLQQYAPWKRFVIPLDDYIGQPVFHFRFHIRSDEFITEDGVYIDDVMLLASDVTPPSIASGSGLPERFNLDRPYPNPFNSRLNVPFTLPDEGLVKVALFDLTGRPVLECKSAVYPTGAHVMSIDAGELPSGLYIVQASSDYGWGIKKILLVK